MGETPGLPALNAQSWDRTRDQSLLSLTALPADGSESRYDGRPLEPGIHLRWSFRPAMGFPAGGFLLERRTYYFSGVDEFYPVLATSWQELARFDLPTTAGDAQSTLDAALEAAASEALRRISQHHTDLFIHPKPEDIQALVAVLHRLTHPRPGDPPPHRLSIAPEEDRPASGVDFTALDMIFLASLDPTIARMLGLYWIDSGMAPGKAADYRLTGFWGSQQFPLETFDLSAVDRLAIEERGGFRLGQVSLFSERKMILATDTNPPQLTLSGAAELPLWFVFDYPVEQVRLDISRQEGTPAWSIVAISTDRGTSFSFDPSSDTQSEVRTASDGLLIRSSHLIKLLKLSDPGGESNSWILSGISYRERTGQIETQRAMVSVNPIDAQGVSPAEVNVREPPPTVSPPPITRPKISELPPGLQSDGTVPKSNIQVEILCQTGSGAQDPYQPVRFHVRRGHEAWWPGGSPSLQGTRVLTAAPVPLAQGHQLVAAWRFDADTRDTKTGYKPRIIGRLPEERLLRPANEDWENPAQQALSLPGDHALAVHSISALDAVGDHLTLQAWVSPHQSQHNDERDPTLLGNGSQASFRLGLLRVSGRYRVRFWLNGSDYVSRATIPPDEWTHLTASYDGETVRFYLDGQLDSTHPARLGPVGLNPLGILRIGSESDASESSCPHPFRGKLANVAIWRRAFAELMSNDPSLLAAWPLDGHVRELKSNAAGETHGRATFVPGPAQRPGFRAMAFDGGTYVAARQIELGRLSTRFTLQALVNPEPAQSDAKLIDNNRPESFALGLNGASRTSYRLRFWLNGRLFESTEAIPADTWTPVTASYDGERVSFYLGDRLESTHPARLGPVRENPQRFLSIGAASSSAPDSIEDAFRGKLARVGIWSEVPGPPAPALASYSVRQDIGQEEDPPAPYIDRRVPDGNYGYQVQGVDIFGRVGPWGTHRAIPVGSILRPPSPANPRAIFLPLRGSLRQTGEWLVTDIELPGSLDAEDLIGYDLQVFQSVEAGPPSEPDRVRRQTFEIKEAEVHNGLLRLRVTEPPFSQLTPARGDLVRIEIDTSLRITWVWTGMQRLHNPDARSFKVYVRPGPLNVLNGRVRWVAKVSRSQFRVRSDIAFSAPDDELAGKACQVGQHRYKVESHHRSTSGPGTTEFQLKYEGRPVIQPRAGQVMHIQLPPESSPYVDYGPPAAWGDSLAAVDVEEVEIVQARSDPPAELAPLSDTQWKNLREDGVDWLPQEHVYQLKFPGVDLADALRVPRPADYVPGALAAFDLAQGANRWRVFNVLWHAWSPDGVLRLYIFFNDPNAVEPPRIQQARFYPGQRYSTTLELTPPPEFAPGQATAEYAIGITTTGMVGRESEMTDPVAAIAVDRRRPPPPPAPEVEIGRADYYGQARAVVTWPPAESPGAATYQVYRALDTALYTRDLEQRRLGTGVYAGLTREQVFRDDPDFEAWLPVIARRLEMPDLESTWQTRMFAPRPAGLRPSPDWPKNKDEHRALEAAWQAWDDATPFWRAWADRFYPGRNDRQIALIAARQGNESAFALATPKPVQATQFVDRVNGLARNRYLYRLRTQSAAQLPSSAWGPVSAPRAPQQPKAPRPPVFTKIEAGDRQITLDWALNREPDLKEYRLYRAQSREDLEDLRWFRPQPGVRAIARIADPRVLARRRSVWLPRNLPLAGVVGVYRADEFDRSPHPGDQPRALNYFDPGPPTDSGKSITPNNIVIRRLRAIPDGTPVVLVYRDTAGALQVFERRGDQPPYTDQGLVGLRDYFYRLVAVDRAGNVSEGSKIMRARTLEIEPPPAPEVQLSRVEENDASDRIVVEWTAEPDLEVVMQRRTTDDRLWQTVFRWGESTSPQWEEVVDREETVLYRVWSRTPNKTVCREPEILRAEARDSGGDA